MLGQGAHCASRRDVEKMQDNIAAFTPRLYFDVHDVASPYLGGMFGALFTRFSRKNLSSPQRAPVIHRFRTVIHRGGLFGEVVWAKMWVTRGGRQLPLRVLKGGQNGLHPALARLMEPWNDPSGQSIGSGHSVQAGFDFVDEAVQFLDALQEGLPQQAEMFTGFLPGQRIGIGEHGHG